MEGLYRHFKGGLYYALAVAQHSETKEEMVVYKGVSDDKFWVRPLSMWNEPTNRWPDGVVRPRFCPDPLVRRLFEVQPKSE